MMEGRQRCLACYFKIFFPFYLNVFVTFLLKKFDVVLLHFDLFIILLNPFLASCSFNLCLVIYIHSMKIQGHISRSLWGKLEIKVWSCRYMVSVLFFIFFYYYYFLRLCMQAILLFIWLLIWLNWKVWTPSYRWYGCLCCQEWRRLCLGMQELWWWRAEWFLSPRFV